MSLFDMIFRPDKAKKKDDALNGAYTLFKTLTAYQPIFTSWGGAIYESEIVRAAIDARARHMSKLKVEVMGSANPSLQSKLRQGNLHGSIRQLLITLVAHHQRPLLTTV